MNQLEWMQRQIEKLTTQVNALSTLDKPNRLNAWQPIFQAASYVSATSILFTGADLTTYMTGYVKCRWYQSGWKYGYIASSSLGSGNTTATLVTNTSYTVANAAITDFSISYGNPVDFPYWFNYAPTLSTVSGTFTSASITGKFSITGKTMKVVIVVTITTNGTASGIGVTVPLNCVGGCVLTGRENQTTGDMLQCYIQSGLSVGYIFDYAGYFINADALTPYINGFYAIL